MTFDHLRSAIALQGIDIDDSKSFMLIAHDKDQNIRVVTSGPVDDFIDEASLDAVLQKSANQVVDGSDSKGKQVLVPTQNRSPALESTNGRYARASVKGSIHPYSPYQRSRSRTSQVISQASTRLKITNFGASPQKSSPEVELPANSPRSRSEPARFAFRIKDTEQVTAFLQSRLKRMQQLADKKLAKAWIKGICPKKQAKFPYQNRRRREESGRGPDVPEWWPDIAECRFTEPDHISRSERMALCLHLLRLRPTPSQLKKYNGESCNSVSKHDVWPRGWTGLLNDFAGADVFDELQKESQERTDKRRQLLHQLYEVGQLEERFEAGELDGNHLYTYFEEVDKDNKLLPSKRTRDRPSDFFPLDAEVSSRESSATASSNRQKKQKLNSGKTVAERRLSHTIGHDIRVAYNEVGDNDETLTPGAGAYDTTNGHSIDDSVSVDATVCSDTPDASYCDVIPLKYEMSSTQGSQQYLHGSSPKLCSDISPSYTDSCSSSIDTSLHASLNTHAPSMYMMPLTFDCKSDYYAEAYGRPPAAPIEHRNFLQTHPIVHIPAPHFQGLPSHAVFLPESVCATQDYPGHPVYDHGGSQSLFDDSMGPMTEQAASQTHQASLVDQIHPHGALPERFVEGYGSVVPHHYIAHGLPSDPHPWRP